MSKVKKDSLGDRMKTYESVSRTFLTRRTPVIIRLDGSHFHTFTKKFNKPYDAIFNNAMQNTMKYLCENVQNCVFGYTQSDEITLILCDYKTLTTAAWFDNNVQKMVSTSAALASVAFNNFLTKEALNASQSAPADIRGNFSKYLYTTATFDSRVFNIPKEEVCNCLIWRQKDAIRNSIQGWGQIYFSQKKLEGKSCKDIKEMLLEFGVNWDEVAPKIQRGTCCVKGFGGWIIDNEIPLFTENRNYVESHIIFEED